MGVSRGRKGAKGLHTDLPSRFLMDRMSKVVTIEAAMLDVAVGTGPLSGPLQQACSVKKQGGAYGRLHETESTPVLIGMAQRCR